MKINIAGAGAGKTTKMADYITGFKIPDGKIVFCIAFTNSAAKNIEEKVYEKLGSLPNNLHISTIHSFLYQELIKPYFYFLYGKHFEKLSVIKLSDNNIFKQAKLSELEAENILHFTKIPEKAKWVVYKKSDDRKEISILRKKILNRFSDYCATIFVDEAQDIDKDIRLIFEALDKAGIDINLFGDPKQDVKGSKQFREIINETIKCNSANVKYIHNCYRCPQTHLNISNLLATEQEKQIADEKNSKGSITLIFQSDIKDTKKFLDDGNYGLKYISKKQNQFETHEREKKGERFETLRHEIYKAMKNKWSGQKIDIQIERDTFYTTEQILKKINGSNASKLISELIKEGTIDELSRKDYVQMLSAITSEKSSELNVAVVQSIESIKGLEAKRCLFILTPDLAPYLFQDKNEDNKMRCLLYVALTRSLENLTFFITKEVEKQYSKDLIQNFFQINQ